MMDWIKSLISTRDTQVAARYIGVGLTALSSYLGAKMGEDFSGAAGALGSLVSAGLLFVLDHYSHAKQKE